VPGAPAVDVVACSEPGAPDQPNEDAYAIRVLPTVLFAGVFDGMTTLQEVPALANLPVQPGQLVSHLLAYYLGQLVAGSSLQNFLLDANDLVHAVIVDQLGDEPVEWHALPGSSATVVKVDLQARELEIAHVLDSWCIIYHGRASQRVTSDRNHPFDEQVLHLMTSVAEEQGITPRQARNDPRVQEALIHSRLVKNNARGGSGVGVVNGDPGFAPYIETQNLPLEGVTAVVLGTDGLLPLGWSLDDEDDRLQLLNEIKDGGLQALLARTRSAEAADLDWHVPRFKASDDATGIALFFKDGWSAQTAHSSQVEEF
jgi:serine/threonine protein phosphatase PrpC